MNTIYECQYCQKHYKDVAALYNHHRIHVLYDNFDIRTTTLIENNSNGSADENTNTNDKMVTTNFGNVVHDGIRQNSDKTNELIVRGNEMQAESNTPRPPKIRKMNLMPTPSNYDTTNTFGANTYTNYEMTNANSGNATVNGIYEYQEINRGDAVLSTKSNIFQTSQIQETNL
ncbi:hypothetical protein T02_8378 [Trichinella nativa]|uniref:C2H2-type domain-containing protein n=1 Tax=Trichinella nativa TaxID=6335 RepID=A0A0V1LGC8_9BILA|nr:hypothetical protein T02_8378 [Trichinella nativa]